MDMLLCPNKETGHVTIAIVKPVNVSQSGSANNTAGVCILLKKKKRRTISVSNKRNDRKKSSSINS